MTNYNLVFYADSERYKNKRFKFKLQESSWLGNAHNVLEKFFESGNSFRSAMIIVDHLNRDGTILKSQKITIPLATLFSQVSSQ